MFGFKRRRRRRLSQRPFPPEWRAIIERNVPYCRLFAADERKEMQGHIQVFLREKRFEGCGGLELTDEMRVTIAAQACMLLLNRESDYYPKLSSILVYPARYVVDAARRLPDGTVVEGEEIRAGESWLRGAVVLSWDDARHGAIDVRDGHNVVLHEFAHQLDSESGAVDGAPVLPRRSMYADWARVLGREYERLRDDLAQRRRTLLRPYGATSPAEFFAVVTEMFFEQPVALQRRHPELYEQMTLFYNQDPAARFGGV
ncbi:MAG: zinc-dependent peptidase [Phycisphaerae bacterium]|nr:zinc-dependent peptidase [Phycisphaerae bacterium]